MLVEVTSMIASVSSSSLGSGTVSTRTSRLPCQVTAFIPHSFGSPPYELPQEHSSKPVCAMAAMPTPSCHRDCIGWVVEWVLIAGGSFAGAVVGRPGRLSPARQIWLHAALTPAGPGYRRTRSVGDGP